MKTLFPLILASLLTLTATAAFADDAGPCKQPTVPNDQASDVVVKYFNKHRLEYKACVDKFVEQQKAIVDANSTSNPQKALEAHDAAEAVLKQYNDFVDTLNAHAKAKAEEE